MAWTPSPNLAALVAAALALGLGAGADPAAAAGASEQFQDWRVTCADARPCVLQTQIRSDDNTPLALFAVRDVGDDRRLGEMILPLGLHIPSGVSTRIDQGEPVPVELVACGRNGCSAIFRASAEVLASLRRGRMLSTQIVDARTGRTIQLDFSLMGFTAADASLPNASLAGE